MSISKSYPFTTPGNYTYDSDSVEITGGNALLKDQSVVYQATTNATCFTVFETKDLPWGNGALIGTLVGSASVSGNELDTSGFAGSSWDIDAEDNADSAQTGCIRVKVKPQYSGSPASNNCIFSINKDDGTTANVIELLHLATGSILLTIFDSGGSSIINGTLVAWSPTSGTEYQIDVNYDLTTGATRLFIDGTQGGATQAATGTRVSADANVLSLGNSATGAIDNNNIYTGIVVFSTVQNTANFTPTDWSEIPETIYSTASPEVLFNDTTRMEGLAGFTETSTISGSDNIKYTLAKDGVQYYYNSGWVTSNGTYSQANTAAEIETNKATFTTTDTTMTIRMFLYSDDGSATPSADEIAITYDFHGADSDTVNTCIVYAYNIDGENTVSTEQIIITPSSDAIQYKDNVLIQQTTITVTPDSDGYWEAELVETENMTGTNFYTFNYGGRSYKKAIPDQASAIFWELVDA